METLIPCEPDQLEIITKGSTLKRGQRLLFENRKINNLDIPFPALYLDCHIHDSTVKRGIIDCGTVQGGASRIEDSLLAETQCRHAQFTGSTLVNCMTMAGHFQDTVISGRTHLRAFCDEGVRVTDQVDFSYAVTDEVSTLMAASLLNNVASTTMALDATTRFIPTKEGQVFIQTAGAVEKPRIQDSGFKNAWKIGPEGRNYILNRLLSRGYHGENAWMWTINDKGTLSRADVDLIHHGSLWASKFLARSKRLLKQKVEDRLRTLLKSTGMLAQLGRDKSANTLLDPDLADEIKKHQIEAKLAFNIIIDRLPEIKDQPETIAIEGMFNPRVKAANHSIAMQWMGNQAAFELLVKRALSARMQTEDDLIKGVYSEEEMRFKEVKEGIIKKAETIMGMLQTESVDLDRIKPDLKSLARSINSSYSASFGKAGELIQSITRKVLASNFEPALQASLFDDPREQITRDIKESLQQIIEDTKSSAFPDNNARQSSNDAIELEPTSTEVVEEIQDLHAAGGMSA